MKKLIVWMFVGTAVIVVLSILVFGTVQLVAWIGGGCIFITVLTAFLAKRSFKNTKGMENL